MKKLSYGIAWVCAVLLIGMAYYASYELGEKKHERQVQEETQTVTGGGENRYVLREEDGVLKVYEADGETLFESTEIRTDALPEQLQEELGQGKVIEDSASLYSFLENYSS